MIIISLLNSRLILNKLFKDQVYASSRKQVWASDSEVDLEGSMWIMTDLTTLQNTQKSQVLAVIKFNFHDANHKSRLCSPLWLLVFSEEFSELDFVVCGIRLVFELNGINLEIFRVQTNGLSESVFRQNQQFQIDVKIFYWGINWNSKLMVSWNRS